MMNTVQREQVGARIKALRKERHWSQADLAEAAGVSERTIYSIENGQHVPQPKKMRAILDALDVQQPEEGAIVVEGMPDDIAIFLRVAAHQLGKLDESVRSRVLNEIYPKLMGEIGRE
jgi:putative transcriptional regulator